MDRHPQFQSALMWALFIATAMRAQVWPARPIRIVVPFPAGGTMDRVVRAMAEEMQLGLPILVENRPGAGTVLGVDAVAKSPPDGYTLGCVGNSFTVNSTLVPELPYDAARDFRAITLLTRTPNVIVGHPRVAASGLAELVEYAKSHPHQLTYASVGNGTIQHLAGETFKRVAGIDLLHVPYKGQAPALADLLGGEIDLMIGNLPDSLPHVRAGNLKSFGVTSPRRTTFAPDLATVAEQGYPGFESMSWFGMVAPAAVPDEIASRLNAEMIRALTLPEVRAGLVACGFEVVPGTAEEFAAFLRYETARYAKVVREAHVTLD